MQELWGTPTASAAYTAYWRSHPKPVRELRKIPLTNPDGSNSMARAAEAKKLADMGYLIDVPVMVWDWDPLSAMIVRREQGFTWVPSGNQPPVQVMPGLTFPGLPSYDPANPPPGSIKVTTEFPLSPDLIVPEGKRPFTWRTSNSPDPNTPNGIGATWGPDAGDGWEEGAFYEEKTGDDKVPKGTYSKEPIKTAGGPRLEWRRMS